MDFKNILLFIAVGANLGLSFYLYSLERTHKINKQFALIIFFVATWSFEVAMFRCTTSKYALWLWLNSYYFTASLIALLFYRFSRVYPFESTAKKNRFEYSITHIGIILVFYLIFFGGSMVNAIYFMPDQDHLVDLRLINYFIYSLYFLGTIGLGFYHMYSKYRASVSYIRRSILIVMIASAFSALTGIISDIILPLATYRYIWIGPACTVVMVFVITKYVFMQNYE